MLIHELRVIGNRMLVFRKRTGLTQAEVAEAAGIADRTYADIERGSVNMRIETFLRICEVLHVCPDELLTNEEADGGQIQREIVERLEKCSENKKATALKLLSIYLDSH